jgi:hypothetical protein
MSARSEVETRRAVRARLRTRPTPATQHATTNGTEAAS